MSVGDLSPSTQNYLKAIWALAEWSDEPVTSTSIAKHLDLRKSTVSEAVRKLGEQDLVQHQPYGAVTLTETGHAFAVAMIRRHRLIETFLVEALGYTWDQVHDEAENLEHSVSDFMVERIDAFLDHPTRDPHGDPIPSASGRIDAPQAVPLTGVEPGQKATIERISDDDPKLLQFLDSHGLVVGATLEVGQGAPYSGALEVRLTGASAAVPLGQEATDSVFVRLEA
ncbi:metal-dependent transcriptional regulator [Corynebacterium sp. HMSC29G08]|uniref:metal-dependent transcriptional regulator n=1 Tax=Corynebacterium sp. HMSC29G08 TaxID=1581069 RepID=UPI0008A2C9EA|nr:metal-dependent transcriptional regulator [Corynebacterium sp. HMSC29G08]OFT81335.1 transcriptional regulator [Corynebacterium sp. HMSC29G08]